MELLMEWAPVFVVALVGVAALAAGRAIAASRRGRLMGLGGIAGQLVMVALTVTLLVAIVVALPIEDSARGQLLTLLGLLLTGAIALSSTTFLGNAMAGLMLRAVGNFRGGDFLKVGDHFGRVSERGLLHTEIQTPERDLLTLPNLYLVTNPVRVIRASGTVIWAEVSLGYDVPRATVDEALALAASSVGLTDPFVQVMDLGDFYVVYRAAGFLEEVKHVVAVRSALRAAMIDTLHARDVEIVSPTFMNQRVLNVDRRFVPRAAPPAPTADEAVFEADDRVFDKAESAAGEAALELELERLKAEETKLASAPEGATPAEQAAAAEKRARLVHHRESIEERLASKKAEAKGT